MISVYKNFLSIDECCELKHLVNSNQSDWNDYPDSNGTSISIYGNSYYRHLLATKRNIAEALKLYAKSKEISSDAYRQFLIEKFSTIFKQVSYINGFSIPGFQIVDQEIPRVWHYDDEKIRYPYKSAFSDYNNMTYFDRWITFTIMLTDGDFSQDYYSETQSAYKEFREYYCKKHNGLIGDDCDCDLKEYKTIKYSVGDMIFADGRYLHRVGKSSYYKDKRITIQGHIVTKGDSAYLYW
jgi:hypothetical protein